ncbi:non-canonical purine NTP pyrophosphatase [Patescibacteria group bacterium]
MMKVLVGTTNPGKIEEMSRLLADGGFEIVTLADLDLGDVEETGTTFEENALLKARHYAKLSGLVTVADDGGLEIDALGGAPGVYSKRWVGEDASWEDLAREVMKRMYNVRPEHRTARLRTVVAVVRPDGEERTAEAGIEGRIAEELDEAAITAGFPYRVLLVVDRYGKPYSDLTEEEHAKVNHRREAVLKLMDFIRDGEGPATDE